MFDDEDDAEDEVEVMIMPRDDVLEKLGIDLDAFEDALPNAIDQYHELVEGLGDAEDAPVLEDMAVKIGDRSFRLGDIAEVTISEGGFDDEE